MKLYDYLMLSEREQMTKAMVCGKPIAKLHLKTSSFVLYAINNFFFEIEYLYEPEVSRLENVVLSRHIFKTGYRLEKYLTKELII